MNNVIQLFGDADPIADHYKAKLLQHKQDLFDHISAGIEDMLTDDPQKESIEMIRNITTAVLSSYPEQK